MYASCWRGRVHFDKKKHTMKALVTAKYFICIFFLGLDHSSHINNHTSGFHFEHFIKHHRETLKCLLENEEGMLNERYVPAKL